MFDQFLYKEVKVTAQVVMRIPEMSAAIYLIFNLLLFGLLVSMAYLMIRSFWRGLKAGRQKIAIKYLSQSILLGQKTTQWLKEHRQELESDPMATLNHSEFVAIIEEDQALYDKICSLGPDYRNSKVLQPKVLHQKMIDTVNSSLKP